jgi:hypothetical protein
MEAHQALAVAVLELAVRDLAAGDGALRRSAEQFFNEGDFRSWCAVAGVEPASVLAILQRFADCRSGAAPCPG